MTVTRCNTASKQLGTIRNLEEMARIYSLLHDFDTDHRNRAVEYRM